MKFVGAAPTEDLDLVRLVDVGDVVESATIANIVSLTQAEYDALTPKVTTTLYVITD